jgi:nickel-dependent lactate racemase
MCRGDAGWTRTRQILQQLGIDDRVLFSIAPAEADPLADVSAATADALTAPQDSPSLTALAATAETALILADDLTRATPRREILPPVLDLLTRAGMPEDRITVLIATGTHRPMTSREIEEAFGHEIVSRVKIVNHNAHDPRELTRLGATASGTPVVVNRRVADASLVIGVGSIIPHPEAGWGGGAKILQPGACGEETTNHTHMLAADHDDYLGIAGHVDNPIRREMESVARQAGLRFIVNAVFDASGRVVGVVAGDPVTAHRQGVRIAETVFIRRIPARADVVVVDAYPADQDYWQGLKPLALATRAVRKQGVLILVASFPDGISPVYEAAFLEHGRKSHEEIRDAVQAGTIGRTVAGVSLHLHARVTDHARVICVSEGMSENQKVALGFGSAASIEEALRDALSAEDGGATLGLIAQGGEVLPLCEEETI